MNPSTGTFTSMDPYAGTIFDPVSLHKYLYANANPVMNRDPSGEFTLLEMELTMAISGEISGALNLLYYDFHGGDRSATSTRIGILFTGFFQGALMTGGLVGLGLIGTVASRIVLSFILMCLGINSMAGAIDRFQAGDDVWGWIFTGASILCFFGAVDSITQAIRIYGINNDNTSLANANATKGGGATQFDILSTKNFTNRNGQVNNYTSIDQGEAAAIADFDALNPSNVRTYSSGTIVGDLPNGTTVNLHPSKSLGGTPTLEFYDPITGLSEKIRY